jgi:hypothetical protein
LATHAFNTIIKFADDTTDVVLITNDKTAYREEVRALAEWCHENNLHVNKTRELIMGDSMGSMHPSTSKGPQWRR